MNRCAAHLIWCLRPLCLAQTSCSRCTCQASVPADSLSTCMHAITSRTPSTQTRQPSTPRLAGSATRPYREHFFSFSCTFALA